MPDFLSAVISQVWLPAASATAFNWSSVAARPVVAVPFQVVLARPVTWLFVPSTVTLPILAVVPVIVPVAPFKVTALAPPVVSVLFTPSITDAPIVALPVVPSIVTALAPEPNVTLLLSFTS